VNLSSDKEQEYFSEGLTEELLNSLSRINELQVAARTSSFSFQGEHPDIATVAHRLNVGAVLEGSVRRSANTVRVTAQLVNAVTGFHLWSETYDRDLRDVLKLQTEIATAVASALKVTLLGDAAVKIEVGGTRNPAAFDAYVRGWLTFYAARKPGDYQPAIDLHSQAIEIDPNYALAFAARSLAFANYALTLVEYANAKTLTTSLAARDSALSRALEDAHKAIALAPTMGEGYSALGLASANALEFRRADAAMERALALAPGNARVLRLYGFVTAPFGRVDAAIATGRQALLLDPLNVESAYNLSGALFYSRRYTEALAVLQKGGTDPALGEVNTNRGTTYYALGNYEGARASCELDTSDVLNLTCLAITYQKIGRHSDAEAVLKKIQASSGEAALYQYARIYAQWGNGAKALECLDSALRLRDPDLMYVKMDPLLDPIRKEPRFRAIERELRFPELTSTRVELNPTVSRSPAHRHSLYVHSGCSE
jgi:TolB-like protein/Flp pilus assembly protein TadD